jgi:hypothetical protein
MPRPLVWLCAALVLLFTRLPTAAGKEDNVTEGRLLNHLLEGYQMEVRPPKPVQDAILKTHYQLNMFHLVGLDEKMGTWELIIWVRVSWKESRMSWNPEDWGGIRQMQIDSSKLWTPSFLFYQQVSQDVIINTAGYVGHDGAVFWSTPTRLLLNCVFSLESFPNDEQHCSVYIEGWNYHGLLQDLRFMQVSSNDGARPFVSFVSFRFVSFRFFASNPRPPHPTAPVGSNLWPGQRRGPEPVQRHRRRH